VYHVDVEPTVVTINTQTELDEFAEEQFFIEGPMQLEVAELLCAEAAKVYCGVE